MTPQPDLAAFLAARLDEDEAAARAARLTVPANGELADQAGPCINDAGYAHIARHEPARVLREVAAKRAILAEHEPEPWGEPHPELLRCAQGHGDEYWTAWPCAEVSALAAVYGGHPGYRQEWKP